MRLCLDNEDMINSINNVFEKHNYFGEKITEILVQERIKGDEYIVNTVSHEGIHYVTLIWKYEKINSFEGAMICDNAVTVDELGIGEAEMIEYAYKVLDAIGIQYGPVHGEYMIDENGPVLIEVNCRPVADIDQLNF